MNPLLSALNSLPAASAQGTINAADTTTPDSGAFAQLLGQLTPAMPTTAVEASDDTRTETSEDDALTSGDPAVVAPHTNAQGDIVVPAFVEAQRKDVASGASLVTGLLEHLSAASSMQSSPQSPTSSTPTDSTPLETASQEGGAVARAIPTLSAEKQDLNRQLVTTNAIATPTAPLTAHAAELENASNAIAAPIARATAAAIGSLDVAYVTPPDTNATGGPAPAEGSRLPEAMHSNAKPGDHSQAQTALLERVLVDQGSAARGLATAREAASAGAPQALLDLVRQASDQGAEIAAAQALARNEHGMPLASTASLAAGRAPQSMGIDDMTIGSATAFARDTPAGMAPASLLGTTWNTRASGSSDTRERNDVFLMAGAASVATSLRGDPVTTVSIAPRMDTPEWQPAFARSVKLLVNDGTTAASLQLNPAEFGPIDVRIVINNQRADISFLVTSPNADAALQSALPELRDQLARSGIQLGQTSVGTQAQEHRQPADTPRRENAAPPAAAPSVGAALPSRPRTTSQIDTFA